MYDVIDLIAQTFNVNAIGDQIATETRRTVYAVVDSYVAKRKIENLSAGTKPEIKFLISNRADYEGEQIVEYAGARYNVTAVAFKDNDVVELTARIY